MDLLRLRLGAIGAACAVMLGMGAIEFGPPPGGLPAAPEPSGKCPWDCGDFNGDVGIVDFLFLLSQWDDIGTSCDFDGGGVGIVDFLKLLANWGVCPGIDVCSVASGDCCVDNGTPGCNDPTCCSDVCEIDPFCCDITWDGNCALIASQVCEACDDACLNGTGNCCVANGTPGCDDPTCCDAVCSIDPFCCDATWDGSCADLASQVCDCGGGELDCGVAGAGDCCVANGSPFCDDATCCDFVCSIVDPFCCDVEWDATCADAAAQFCACP